MEPMVMAICAASVFETAMILAVFIRHLMLSRDKELNEKAQMRALVQQTHELERIRQQMEAHRGFKNHYRELTRNRRDIQAIGLQIEEILERKSSLVGRYAEHISGESVRVVQGDCSAERRATCEQLRQEMDLNLRSYDKELKKLQARREALWETHTDFQTKLLEQEGERSKKLDGLYLQHSEILGKLYLANNNNAAEVAKETIQSGSSAFQVLTAPFRWVAQLFSLSNGIAVGAVDEEYYLRRRVIAEERNINQEYVIHRLYEPGELESSPSI